MTRRYIFQADGVRRYALVSTTAVGRPGPPGADGSGLPGVDIDEIGINAEGEVSFGWSSHFGITAAGVPYYSANPDTIPEDEMAWYDVTSNSLVRGIPGRVSSGSGSGSGFRHRGQWQPNTAYAANDVVFFGGSSYLVLDAFTSGTSFTTTHLQLWAQEGPPGDPGPAGPGVFSGTTAPTNDLGIDGSSYIWRVLDGDGDLLDVRLYGPKAGGVWAAEYASLLGPAGASSSVPGPQGPPGPGVPLSTTPPRDLGFDAHAGGSTNAARDDHVHKSPIPGIDFTLHVESGSIAIDIVTNFGIDEGGAYFDDDPNAIAEDERAIFNPFDRTLELL